MNCEKCEVEMEFKKDFIYGIEYLSCPKCGSVKFLDDGLGILRYKLPKNTKVYHIKCYKCGKEIEATAPKEACKECKC
jgi:Zn-finger nucleic acid-binding protein